MSGEKHPILIVLIILGATALFLGSVMAAILLIFGQSAGLSFDDRIGVIPIQGPILDSEPIVSQLVDLKRNRKIKAIILRIDSPGGGVGPSQEIYREVRKTIKAKKVVVSMGSLAASGGYYIAAAADRIVANPGTITGSVGVIMEFVRIEDLLKKIGVSIEVLKSGEFKDIGSPHREMSPQDKELIQGLISEIQDQFVNAVASGRDLSVEKVQEIADGRIFTGARAKELGLVDLLGNFQDAVDLTKKLAGIHGDVTLVYPKEQWSGFWDLFFGKALNSLYRSVVNYPGTLIEYRWDGLSSTYD